MKKYLWVLLIVWLALLFGWCARLDKDASYNDTSTTIINAWSSATLNAQQIEKLEYLIQEEKLARDVYLQMYKLWWNKKFYNIINSEENHQSQVARILDTYTIQNPIQDKWPGEFADTQFVDLYNQLVASGSASLADSLQVGIDIETMDIKDIEEIMPLFDGKADIQQMLNSLLEWSKRHLSAFSR